MKRSSNAIRNRRQLADIGLACLLASCAMPLHAQTLGQQVDPQPMMGSQSSGQSNGNATGNGNNGLSGGYPSALGGYGQQQQSPSMPMNVPGTVPMNDMRVGQFGTGSDIPQSSPVTVVSVGDLLDIVIFETPELSGRFRIGPKGDILLPLVGNLHVADMTIAEVTEAVTERYKQAKILVDPQVTVFVAEYTRRAVTITGEVRSPGVYQIPAPRTLFDTMAMAGGLNDTASRTVSIVHASDPKNIIHVTLNVGPQTPESIEEGRMQILPGDSIYVARSGIVYMVGELQRPGGFQVEHNNRLTLLEALALAGGPAHYAKLSNARLIRRSPTGREELKVNLQKVLLGGGPDMLLTDGDIVYVPTSLLKEYSDQAINAAIGSATGLAIYRVGQ